MASINVNSLERQRVLVIGLGVSGQAAAEFLLRRGANVSGIDRNDDLLNDYSFLKKWQEKGMNVFHESISLNIEDFDLVVVSPGIPVSHPYYSAAKKAGVEVVGEVELACRYLQRKVFAITGTNGKTTTAMMVTHVLNQVGIPAQALGNIGVPLSAELMDPTATQKMSIAVLELSSFQLETLKTPIIDAGVILNITPDHLDRYPSLEDYARSKIHLAHCLKPGGKLFVEEKCHQTFASLFRGIFCRPYGYTPSCEIFTDGKSIYNKEKIECFLPARYRNRVSHEVENLMAAFALCREAGVEEKPFIEAVESFKKPAHRLEFVRRVNGVDYYDDSKGTNVDAVIRAVEELQKEIILVAGGMEKGAAYTPWIAGFKNHVKGICAIGVAAEKIKKELSQAIPVELFDSLEKAVKYAGNIAEPGQAVLLSPGCSSFDMFRDYIHRGEEFKRIVNALNEGES